MVLTGEATVPLLLSAPLAASAKMTFTAGVGKLAGLKTSISFGVSRLQSCSCSASKSERKSPRSGSRYLPYSHAA